MLSIRSGLSSVPNIKECLIELITEEEDDYESLPDESPVAVHMVAGACAGVLEHILMYPVDCVKTRLQCPNPEANYRGLMHGLYRLTSTEGVQGAFRGMNVVMIGAAPAHAAYFACYEFVKSKLVQPQGGHANHLAHGTAGCCATMLHDAVMTPTDAIKQRLQMYHSPYQGGSSCARAMWSGVESGGRVAGYAPFFRAYTTQLSMNIPMQCTHFIVYELAQNYLNPQHQYLPSSHVISGALAGGLAAAITTPLDVCKTYLNTTIQPASSGLSTALRGVYALHGMAGFYRGLVARVVFQMPGTAISWSVYEFFKYLLGGSEREDHRKVLDPHPPAISHGSAIWQRPQI